MAKDKSGKKNKGKKNKKDKKALKLQKKKKEQDAKKKARKGDGTFPDTLIVTHDGTDTKDAFTGHDAEDLSGIYEDGRTVAVYKLRKVSKVSIKRKIER